MGFQEDRVCLKHNLLPISVFSYLLWGRDQNYSFLIKIVVRFGFFSLVMCGFVTNSLFLFCSDPTHCWLRRGITMITPQVSIPSSGLFSSDTSVSQALKGLWEPHQLAVS